MPPYHTQSVQNWCKESYRCRDLSRQWSIITIETHAPQCLDLVGRWAWTRICSACAARGNVRWPEPHRTVAGKSTMQRLGGQSKKVIYNYGGALPWLNRTHYLSYQSMSPSPPPFLLEFEVCDNERNTSVIVIMSILNDSARITPIMATEDFAGTLPSRTIHYPPTHLTITANRSSRTKDILNSWNRATT